MTNEDEIRLYSLIYQAEAEEQGLVSVRSKRPPSNLNPLVQQDERDRQAVEGETP